MKSFTVIGTILLFSIAAVAQGQLNIAQAQAHDMSFLTSGDQSQTPYQKLEALFNSAKPMLLSQFPTPTSPELKNWQCSYLVQPNTTVASLGGVSSVVPALITGTIEVSPAVPSSGPLFPGTPEKDRTVLAIDFIANDGSFSMDAKQIGAHFTSQKIDLVPYPDVSEKMLKDPGNPNSMITTTFRTVNGLIVVNDVAADPKDNPNSTGFGYCWKQ